LETLEASTICLDTSVLIDNLRGREQTVEFIKRFEEAGTTLSTTTINSFELYYGAYRSRRREKNLGATKALLTRLVVLDLTDESSKEAGRILALLEGKGDLIGFRDVLIAAIAITARVTLATRDIEHFSRVPELEVLKAP